MNEANAGPNFGPLMIDVAGKQLDAEDRELLCHPAVGGLILFTRNYAGPEQLRELIAEIRALPRPRLLLAVDHEGGRVQRFRMGFSRIPTMRSLGEKYQDDPQAGLAAAFDCGSTIGRELAAFDIDLCFAPVLDRDCGISKVIGDRAFSSELPVIDELASEFRRGLNAQGMAATGKHFPGHGAVVADSHTELPVDRRSYAELNETELQPFAVQIRAGIESLMMAHVLYPQVDNLPASLSPHWIQTVLRGELGYSGAVICDDLSMHGAAIIENPVLRLKHALEAGCDMVPVCNDRDTVKLLLDANPAPLSAEAQARLQTLVRKPTEQSESLAETHHE